MKYTLHFLLLINSLAPDSAAADDWPPLVLHYDQPAQIWAAEALPVGNGRLGAMVFGGVQTERLQLNEQSVWAGPPVPELPAGFKDTFQRARGLWFESKHAEAQELVQEHMSKRISPRSHQTLGDLKIVMLHGGSAPVISFTNGQEPAHKKQSLAGSSIPEDYRRELDLDRAVATTTFTQDGVRHRREVFASAPADVLIAHWTADKPGAINALVSLDRPVDASIEALDESTLAMHGPASHDGNHLGVRFQAVLQATAEGGTLKTKSDRSLDIRGADSLTLILGAATDYNQKNPAEPLNIDFQEPVRSIASDATTMSTS